jgi:hypothetical protein
LPKSITDFRGRCKVRVRVRFMVKVKFSVRVRVRVRVRQLGWRELKKVKKITKKVLQNPEEDARCRVRRAV